METTVWTVINIEMNLIGMLNTSTSIPVIEFGLEANRSLQSFLKHFTHDTDCTLCTLENILFLTF